MATVALRIVSACKTAEQFVSTFARYCDQTSLYIATASPKPLGTQVRFSLTLAGGNPVMSGLGRVVESHAGSAHRFGRPGMRIRFDELDDISRNWVRVLTAQSGKPRTTGQIAAVPPPAPPAEAAATPAPPAEQRTPGSPVVLPANPLSRMDDESIELLVECSLYEVTEDELRAITFDEDTDVVSPMAFLASAANGGGDPAERPGTGKLIPRPPILPGEREFSRDASRTLPGNAVKVAGPSGLPPLPRPFPLAASPHTETQKGIPIAEIINIPADEVEALDEPPPVPGAVAAAVEPPPLPPPVSPVVPDVDELLRRPRQFSVQIMVAVGVAAAAIGVALGYAIPRSGPSEARASRPDAPVAASVAASETETASREPAPPAAARKPEPEPEPEPESEPEPAAPAADACTLDISTRPAPVAISIDGQSIGDSPLVHTLPCGQRAVVKFQRARYQSVEKAVKLAPGDRRRLSVTMDRPKVSLRVDTTPRGATVKVDGRRIGSGPATTQVLGFTGVKIEVAKDGFKTARRSVKPGGKPERVSIKLEREASAAPAKKRRR